MRLQTFFFAMLALPLVANDLPTRKGAIQVDLNHDGHLDIVLSNAEEYGVYLYVPKERAKAGLQWDEGWSQVLREGKAGDAHSLPLFVQQDGSLVEVSIHDEALWLGPKQVRLPFSELLKVPGPQPLPPAAALKSLQLKPGYRATLVAHEPLVQDPVFIDWDAQGRLWVVEMGDYPFAPGEKTKDGSVGQGQVSTRQTGRVKILEDTNDDGTYDKATLFLDGLKHPTGLAFWKGGVFIANIPDIFYAEDTDGDGHCDKREAWFTGFTAGNPQHLVNGFCWGLDGWLYGANGDSGGSITCVKSGQKVELGTNDFRFDPRTGEFALEGGRSQYGKWRDDYGNWFGNNNSTMGWHYWLPFRYLEKHPEVVAKSVRALITEDKRLYPSSAPLRRFNQKSSINTLTSGCSPMPCRTADAADVLLICEPANNLVHREVLQYSGPTITSTRHPEDQESEFIASTDPWFRPTQARIGPDGALYVVDMYRLVLEHPEWIPADIAHGLDLRAGEDRGRIYRIAKADAATQDRRVQQPISAMASPIGAVRDTAQRLLLERADTAAIPALQRLLQSSPSQPVRIQAGFTLMQLGGLKPEALWALLQPLTPRVRAAALTATGVDTTAAFSSLEKPLLQQPPSSPPPSSPAAAPMLTQSPRDRQKVVARYIDSTATLTGDSTRGRAVFQKNCQMCHRVQTIGVEVGPDLTSVATKPRQQLIEALFDPNRAVEQRNATTHVQKKDNSSLAGQLISETPSSLTLRLPGGVDFVVLRSDVVAVKTLITSLMPEGLEAALSAQDVADVLAFISSH